MLSKLDIFQQNTFNERLICFEKINPMKRDYTKRGNDFNWHKMYFLKQRKK